MRPRLALPLAALFTLAASPALAVECRTGQFTPEALKGPCGGNDDKGEARCQEFQTSFLAACKDAIVKNLTVQHRLGLPGPPLTTAQEQARKTAAEGTMEAYHALTEATNASEGADAPAYAQVPAFVQTQKDVDFRLAAMGRLLQSAAENEALRIAGEPPVDQPPPINDASKERAARLAEQAEKRIGNEAAPDPEKVAKAAELYLSAGDSKDAERLARRLVETAPKDSRGPSLLAETALSNNRLTDAERWAQKALALNPNDKKAKDALAFARSGLSASHLKKPVVGNFAEARGLDLHRGLEIAAPGAAAPARTSTNPPADPVRRVLAGLLRRGYEKMNLGDLPGALGDVSVHLDSHPEDADARLIRAEILLKLGKPVPALADIDLALAKTPDDPRALRARAAALYEIGGRDGEALTAVERALALEPASGIGHLTRAKILERLDRVPEAIVEYRAAAQLDPALEPIVEAALRRLGAAPPAASKSVERGLLRGGFLTVSLALILFGLLGGAVVATRRARTAEAAAAAAARERTLKSGDLVAGQYRISRELGRGGMGVVFEAVDENLKRSVALKQLQGDYRASAEDAARFLQEARLVAQLRHPNVAGIYAAVEDGGLYLVFELVRGRSLDSVLGAGVTPEQARGIVAHACAALTAAHARRIIHRDLKPSNLMISDDGVVKVMDFGIAHQSLHGGAFTQTSASGTPPYMAPEQAMGSVSSSSDLYALGVMAYELLTGVRPFSGPDFLGPKMRGEFAPATSRKAALPPRLDAFFASALSPDPTRRPRDAAAFAAAFAGCWS